MCHDVGGEGGQGGVREDQQETCPEAEGSQGEHVVGGQAFETWWEGQVEGGRLREQLEQGREEKGKGNHVWYCGIF